jgi:uncharacterized SAM-binding protein YcdF (DUF218 family)
VFFILSKILWVITAPSNFFFFLVFFGTLVAIVASGRVRRVAQGLCLFGALGLGIIGFSPLGSLVTRSLEDRFPQPDLSKADPVGIIVLGGAIDANIGFARHDIHLSDGAERLTTAAILARQFPKADLIYTGGSNSIFGASRGSEAEDAKRLWVGLGIAPERIKLEDKSRNTYENAVFTRDLLHPGPGQRYLLVTSAFHMPRSVGLFRKADFDVIPVPVDYQTLGNAADLKPRMEIGEGLHLFNLGVRDWLGLIAYRLTGKIDTFFPGP